MITVTFIVKEEGGQEVTRGYKGDFYKMHNKEWNEEVQDVLDTHFKQYDNDSE